VNWDAIDQGLVVLVRRLVELSRSGRVRWQLAEDDRDDSFTYVGPSGAVTVYARDRDGRDPYVLTIRDADGRLVERVDHRWEPPGGDADLHELYRIARRQALRADAVIEALLRDLE
jgi:hypothetical protein